MCRRVRRLLLDGYANPHARLQISRLAVLAITRHFRIFGQGTCVFVLAFIVGHVELVLLEADELVPEQQALVVSRR